ncbi:unnamed protein product [Caenorhabditis bovis]|uniref:MAM domain-containing protein n=1 Tax=Caenorhabditis bovis TaxID=2654633 RepID=A0A8S1EDU0_9PELO|nr:unnamed protein product [Caenorhabditis bovis]
MPSILLLFILIFGRASSCHSFGGGATYSGAGRARARGVTSMDRNPIDLDYSMDERCVNVRPYSPTELKSSASLLPLPDVVQLAVKDGGRITCGFDDEMEYCSWHNAADTLLKFWLAKFDQFFDLDRFDCINSRRFAFEKNFLLAGGEPLIAQQTVALETEVPCQFGDAKVRFDVWASSDKPILRYCITKTIEGEINCEDILPMPNPVQFTVPMTSQPIKIRIEIVNVQPEDIVLIDNLYYDGQVCELVDDDEEEATTTTTTTTTSPSLITAADSEVAKFFEDTEKPSIYGIKSTESLVPLDSSSVSFNELTPCSALRCTFNDGDSCFYGLSGIGSTQPWLLSDKLVGNRHTGIQRINVEDQDKVGFVYVGDDVANNAENIFVMESPKFTLNSDAVLIFDVYLRSISPRLKVCIDSFDDCPYSSPALEKHEYWHFSHKVPLKTGASKVFFVATNVKKHQFLAVDNIRLENPDGTSYCTS